MLLGRCLAVKLSEEVSADPTAEGLLSEILQAWHKPYILWLRRYMSRP